MTANNEKQSKYTYATLCGTDSYAIGVKKLFRSLVKTETAYPLICLCSIGVSDDTIKELENSGICCRKLTQRAVDWQVNKQAEFSHWNNTFDKLLLWGLTEYEKIVYLDSDMIVLSNVDELFNHPNFSAVQAGHALKDDWIRLNSGTLVIEPDVKIMNALIKQIPITVAKFEEKGSSVGDQDVINDYIPDWHSRKQLILPESYNVFYKNINVYCRNYGFAYNNSETIGIKVVHFIGKRKPWHSNTFRDMALILKYLITGDKRLKAFIDYLKL